MTTATATTAELIGSRHLRARLGSLLAVAPLGLWTAAHLWDNLDAWKSPEAWQESVTSHAHPLAHLLTVIVVLLPLALHTAWGIKRLFSARPNNVRYGFYANMKYGLQRLSAIGLLLFLGAHLWLAMLHPRLSTGRPEQFADISHEMRFHMPTLVVYLLGTLGVSYHLANGLQTFALGWGLVSSRRSLKQLEIGVLGLFALLLAMSWGAVYGLYSAAH